MILPLAICPSRAAEEPAKFDFTIDFGEKGYWMTEYPVVVGLMLRPHFEGYTEGDFDDAFGSMLKIDLDRDGTFDIASVARWVTDGGMPQEIIVPLPGNSLREEVTITGTDDEMFSTVTFKPAPENVNDEYTITVIGGKAYTGYQWDSDSNKQYHVKAAPGTLLSIQCEAPKGQYVKQFQTSDVPMYEDFYFVSYLRDFVMPAHDVTINVVTAPQETGIIEVGQNESVTIEEGLWTAYCAARGVDVSNYGYKDLDGDGTYDISIGGMGTGRGILPFSYRSVTDEYVVRGENPGLRYNCIILRFSDGCGAYELNMEQPVELFYENVNGEAVLFQEYIKEFEMTDFPGLYDFDKDGTPDAWYDAPDGGNCLMSILPTYSLGERYTIPAEQLGEWKHPITFVLNEKPKFHTITLETGQGGTAELYMQAEMSYSEFTKEYPRVSGISDDGKTAFLSFLGRSAVFHKIDGNQFLGKAKVYVVVTPDDGYEVDAVTADGNAVCMADCLFHVDNADAVISVTFRKIPEPTPIATPSPTLEPSPTPEQDKTVSPAPVTETDDREKNIPDEDNSFQWILGAIIAVLIIAFGGVTFVLLRRRKRHTGAMEKDE